MVTKKTKVKLSFIRDDTHRQCPFGLGDIPTVCQNAGDSIERMAPTETAPQKEKQAQIKRANMIVYAHHKTGKRCPYADKVLPDHNKVDCDFGDTGQGQRSAPYRGSPLYVQTFQGLNAGLHSFPLGLYSDNSESRNAFFGLFSFLGSQEIKQLVKLADNYDESGDKDRADMIDKIISKLEDVKDGAEHTEALNTIENFLEEYKHKFDEKRQDAGMLFELAQKWFGLRQVN